MTLTAKNKLIYNQMARHHTCSGPSSFRNALPFPANHKLFSDLEIDTQTRTQMSKWHRNAVHSFIIHIAIPG